MKRLLLLTLGLAATFSTVFGQQKEDLSCLDKYEKVFEERGADYVPDGMHRNVIVSITDEYGTNCFYGKARVEGSKVTGIFIKLEDEQYELFEANRFKVSYGAAIKNGISEKWVTKEDNKTMQVIFIESIKPKKKKYMPAPDPDPDKL